MIERLRKRFIRITMLSVISVLLLLSLILNAANYTSVGRDLDGRLSMIADDRGFPPPSGDTSPPEKRPGGRNDDNKELPYSMRYFVLRYTGDGTLIASDLGKIVSVTQDDVDSYLRFALRRGEGSGYTSGHAFRYSIRQTGDGYTAVFLSCKEKMHAVWQTVLLSLAASAVCTLLVYVAVLLFARRAIDPVVQASERQKQFITDASHELKTPITVVNTCLKVLEMENGRQKWIDKALGQTDKLTKLVAALVRLTRMDEEDEPLRMSRFAVSDAVQETAGSFADFAEEAGHELVLSVEPDIVYSGNEYAVRQLVSILLDNAVKYAAPDKPIRFSLSRARRGVDIRCENDCTEPPAAGELGRLFDRFYRADKSRSGEGDSFGIGLSIARGIVEGHHGQIFARLIGDGHTIVFTAELR